MSNHDREGSHPSNRDDDLERAWREASDEQPPAHLDAAIVAAARKSVAVGGEQPKAAPARVRPGTGCCSGSHWPRRPRLRGWHSSWCRCCRASTIARRRCSGRSRLRLRPPPSRCRTGHRRPAATDHSQLPSADKALARPERVVVPDCAGAGSGPCAAGRACVTGGPTAKPPRPASTAARWRKPRRSTRGHATGVGRSNRGAPAAPASISRKDRRRRGTARRGGMGRKGRGAARVR